MHGIHAKKCFKIIHYDVWGVSPVISHAQYKYFVTFIDDYGRFAWVYFLQSKADVFFVFQTFAALIETQFHLALRSCIQIQGMRICLTIFITTYNRNGSFLNALSPTPHNKIG